jgi:creatinine amidohydrolase
MTLHKDSSTRLVSRFWADLSTQEFDQLDKARTIAVLPVAATEQHGPHLSVSVDTDLLEGVIHAALPQLAPELPVLFLPTQPVGFSPEHQAFAGTLSLSAATVIRLWTELGESVAKSGIQKLVLLNSHGGNVGLLDVVARDLRARLNMLVYSVSWFNLPLGAEVDQLFTAQEHRFGIHAGQIETAMMLALKPERVRMDLAEYFASASEQRVQQFEILGNGKSAKLGWQIQDYNPSGALGNAQAATAEQGHAVLKAAGVALAKLLAEIDQTPAPKANS